MEFCKVTSDLNKHLSDLDRNQEWQASIKVKQAEVYSDLLGGQLVWIGNDNYSLDDFLSDFDIDVTYFARFVLGNDDDLLSQAKEALDEYAEKLAIKIINSGV